MSAIGEMALSAAYHDVLKEAKDRIIKLEAALKPFALAADSFDHTIAPAPHKNEHGVMVWHNAAGEREITVGHFRAARTALEDTP